MVPGLNPALLNPHLQLAWSELLWMSTRPLHITILTGPNSVNPQLYGLSNIEHSLLYWHDSSPRLVDSQDDSVNLTG
jgi:hypothetical protein